MMKHGSALRASGRRQQRRVRTIRHCRILVSVVLAALSIPAAFGRGDAVADTLSGPARVVDADTIDVAGERVRLSGIDALERLDGNSNRGISCREARQHRITLI